MHVENTNPEVESDHKEQDLVEESQGTIRQSQEDLHLESIDDADIHHGAKTTDNLS